jgi:hypothetical protein
MCITKLVLTRFSLLIGLAAFGQASGGFDLLNLDPDARSAARGESCIASVDNCAGLYLNPASVARVAGRQAGFVYVDHLQDIKLLNTTFATSEFGKYVLSIGFSHLDYGKMDGRDFTGMPTGDFEVSDNMIHLGAAKSIGTLADGKLDAGLLLKYAWSKIDESSANAIVLDYGLRWNKELFSIGASLRNSGKVLADFGASDTSLPLAFEVGFSNTLKHLPFTLSCSWIKETDLDAYLKTGGEFVIAGRWHLGFGYNFGSADDKNSGIDGDSSKGLSAGIGGEIAKGFEFYWAWTSLGEVGALNRFTLSRGF